MDSSTLFAICSICSKEFKGKYYKTSIKQHTKQCSSYKDFLGKYNLTKEILAEEYITLGSVLEIMKKYPYFNDFTGYYKLFKFLDISVSLKQASNNQRVKDKREQTCLKNFGEKHNFAKNSSSRKEWQKRLFDEEGITNVFQRESVKKKLVQTLIKKYGEEDWKIKTHARGSKVFSNVTRKICNLLSEENISFSIEKKIAKDNTYFSYDIILSDSNKLIEINGDYWHGNPKIYLESDIILKGTSGQYTVGEKWAKDKIKIQYAIDQGYQILVVWEKDLNDNPEEMKRKIIEYANS